jgi:hypothetical protein
MVPAPSTRRGSEDCGLSGVRIQAAVVRALLDEERVAPSTAGSAVSAQLVEELARLGCRLLEVASAQLVASASPSRWAKCARKWERERPAFTEQALNFHHTADTIAEAARQRDRVAVTRALGTTLQTCTGCHAAFRQSVVDEPLGTRPTSTPAPTGHPTH